VSHSGSAAGKLAGGAHALPPNPAAILDPHLSAGIGDTSTSAVACFQEGAAPAAPLLTRCEPERPRRQEVLRARPRRPDPCRAAFTRRRRSQTVRTGVLRLFCNCRRSSSRRYTMHGNRRYRDARYRRHVRAVRSRPDLTRPGARQACTPLQTSDRWDCPRCRCRCDNRRLPALLNRSPSSNWWRPPSSRLA
jgi:hypothetical protein